MSILSLAMIIIVTLNGRGSFKPKQKKSMRQALLWLVRGLEWV
jgi:hypothetical protein